MTVASYEFRVLKSEQRRDGPGMLRKAVVLVAIVLATRMARHPDACVGLVRDALRPSLPKDHWP